MEWIKYDQKSKPKCSGTYLCLVIIPQSRCGRFDKKIMSLYHDGLCWSCENMIVAYWTEMPELPEEIVL